MAFPISPVEGDTYTENNTVWIYSAVTGQWNRSIISQVNETTYIGSDGAPGGIGGNTQVIFNDNGSLASDAGLVYNKTTDVLTAGSLRATSLGTAAAPTFAFTGDPNTGIYSPGADQVAISTNGTGRLFVGSTGTVELTSSLLLQNTSSALNIKNAAGTARNVLFQDSSDNLYFGCTDGPIIFRTGTGSQVERMRLDSSGGFQFKGAGTAGVTQAVSFNGSAPVNSLVIDSSGRLGLGTSSPQAILSTKPSASTTTAATTFTGDGVYIDCANTTDSNGSYGGAISWSRSGSSTTKTAAICNVQTSSDADVQGLAFLTHSSTTSTNPLIEAMRITGAGNVGIGTSPSTALHVSAADTELRVQSTTSTNGFVRFLNTSGSMSIGMSGAATNTLLIYDRTNSQSVYLYDGGASGYHAWHQNGSERARIDSSGRLLVGTSTSRGTPASISAEARLQLEGGDNNTSAFSITNTLNGASSRGPNIRTARIRGTGSVVLDDTLGLWATYGHDGSDFIEAANIRAQVDGNPGTNDMPGRLVFSTTADGASSPTERLRITSAGVLQIADAGNIAVGTTTGTKIGTATTQKLGFFNKTPVVQPTAVADATDAASVITQLNALLSRMRDLGLIAT